MFFISTGKNITSSSFYTLVSQVSTITVFNYPGLTNDYLSLGIINPPNTPIIKASSKTLQSGDGTINETTYNVSINPSINSYTLRIRHNSTTPYNYLLLIKNETTGNIVPITGPTKVGSYYNMTIKYQYINVTLNSSYSYDIYAVYYIPVRVQTDFLGKPMNFSTFFKYATIPYNTSLLGFNKYKVDENATYYALPPASQYILDYSGYTYFIDSGFWDNGVFNTRPMANYFGCLKNGTVSSCLTFENVQSQTYRLSGESQYGYYHGLPWFLINVSSYEYPGNVNETCQTNAVSGITCTENIDQGMLENETFQMPTPTFKYYILSSSIAGITQPGSITLNYGYYIPIYLGANANYSAWCGNGYYNSNYPNINSALNNSANNTLNLAICISTSIIPGRPHPELNLYMFNVNSSENNFAISDWKIQYTETKIIYQTGSLPEDIYYSLENTPDGFTSTSPLVADKGSSTDRPINGEYHIYNSYPSSWSVDNGYIFYEKDSG